MLFLEVFSCLREKWTRACLAEHHGVYIIYFNNSLSRGYIFEFEICSHVVPALYTRGFLCITNIKYYAYMI